MSIYSAQPATIKDPYKVMIVDDSAIIRGILTRQLEECPEIKVVSSCANGKIAVEKLPEVNPDVIVLDIEMPVMDGLTALPLIRKIDANVKIIMASTLTLRNAEISFDAMRKGANDYIPKPTSTTETMGSESFKHNLLEKVRTWGQKKRSSSITSNVKAGSPAKKPATKSVIDSNIYNLKPQIITIGVSTGGPQALLDILTPLSGVCNLPILITQHMPPRFTTVLANQLKTSSGCNVKEAADGDVIQNGTIYVAPGDYHMIVVSKDGRKCISLNQEPHENFCRPAADPMFRSIAKHYEKNALALILTGMGSDGTKGAKYIIDAGGKVLAQDEETSVVWGMPGAAVQAGVASAVMPLQDIGNTLKNFVQQRGF